MRVATKDLKINEVYDMTFPNGANCTAELKNIKTNSLGTDYYFTWQSGYDGLCNEKHNKPDNPKDFPFPDALIGMVTFRKV